jgi:hypothetical protein
VLAQHLAQRRVQQVRGRVIALGIAPTFAPIPNPLSRTQFVIVRFPNPPEPAVAASAPMSPQSIGLGIPLNLKNPENVVHQCVSGTKAMFTKRRKLNTTNNIVHANFSSIRSIVPPNERIKITTTIKIVAVQLSTSLLSAVGTLPIQALSSVAAALPANAGQPNCRKPRTV